MFLNDFATNRSPIDVVRTSSYMFLNLRIVSIHAWSNIKKLNNKWTGVQETHHLMVSLHASTSSLLGCAWRPCNPLSFISFKLVTQQVPDNQSERSKSNIDPLCIILNYNGRPSAIFRSKRRNGRSFFLLLDNTAGQLLTVVYRLITACIFATVANTYIIITLAHVAL